MQQVGSRGDQSQRVTLIEPLALINGREAIFLRDNFGGEVPLSCPYPPLELLYTAALLREASIPVELIAANVLGMHHDAVVARLRPNAARLGAHSLRLGQSSRRFPADAHAQGCDAGHEGR